MQKIGIVLLFISTMVMAQSPVTEADKAECIKLTNQMNAVAKHMEEIRAESAPIYSRWRAYCTNGDQPVPQLCLDLRAKLDAFNEESTRDIDQLNQIGISYKTIIHKYAPYPVNNCS